MTGDLVERLRARLREVEDIAAAAAKEFTRGTGWVWEAVGGGMDCAGAELLVRHPTVAAIVAEADAHIDKMIELAAG